MIESLPNTGVSAPCKVCNRQIPMEDGLLVQHNRARGERCDGSHKTILQTEAIARFYESRDQGPGGRLSSRAKEGEERLLGRTRYFFWRGKWRTWTGRGERA